MTGLTSALLKLLTAGSICGLLLQLGGKGPLREIMRFGCACLVVVVLLTVLRQTELSSGALSVYEGRLKVQVEETQRDVRQTILTQTQQELEKRLEQQAAAFSLDCGISVDCSADQEGLVSVEAVKIRYRSGPREKLQELRESIAVQLVIPVSNIIVTEEEGA